MKVMELPEMNAFQWYLKGVEGGLLRNHSSKANTNVDDSSVMSLVLVTYICRREREQQNEQSKRNKLFYYMIREMNGLSAGNC